MTHIHLIYHGRYPSEKAASLFAAKSAEAFAGVGEEVTLLVPRRLGRNPKTAHEVYGVRNNFKTVFLPTVDLFWIPVVGKIAHQVSYVVFSFFVALYLVLRTSHDTWVVTNESFPALVASFVRANILHELHDFPQRSIWLYRWVFARSRIILATNAWKAKELETRFGVPAEKIIVEPNAVDLAPYENAPSREKARERLNLPPNAKIVVYTGHLYAWKGVDTLAEAASLMPEIEVYIVGGTEYDLGRYKARFNATNLHFTGFRPHDEMPLWQKAADVLVLPNTAKEEISARYTSPMKLFEYMASGTPIVASRIPSIEEIVGDTRATLVEPDNTSALAGAIKTTIGSDSTHQVQSAQQRVAQHTWQRRAERILKQVVIA